MRQVFKQLGEVLGGASINDLISLKIRKKINFYY